MPKDIKKRPKQSPKLLNSELLEGADYVIDCEKGLRRVKPYYFTFKTWVKGRWIGKTLVEIFTTEFRDRDSEYYRQAIIDGRVQVNGEPSNGELILKNGDILTHTSHRHEPPVTSKPVEIVHQDDDLIVINKPAGVPVHPAGRYRHNSVLNILSIEHKVSTNIAPCNRLDRLTSGLMFFSQHASSAEKMRKYLFDREVSKEYVARVIGDFPEGEIICEEPLMTVNPLLGLNRVHPNGKSAKSVFEKLSFNGVTSVVKCRPFTGRTHQLRVHLQFLGHPIANDPLYANKRVWGETSNDWRNKTDEEISEKLLNLNKSELADFGNFAPTKSDYVTEETREQATERRDKRLGELLTGDICDVCQAPLYSDPSPTELGIFLHALKYWADDGSWSYSTDQPDWASVDWKG
ncbi:Uncharacterized protein C18B11.02c [Taphrina deformans PYCC 5710]|uniref:Pseudouridine synthase n=1 Tax=Taphrina deformans (strain PYCC 5710 / ATCC 11124 / CBS 356.35 / IMI 108563 / JCM 9778 / NBRC 8474) TaxID=1097556 RepID=R4XCD7_TAPDE|nr:Uncharacterized protein C18B11.02c [Taphrina deformans PYCC 5710]|eukprot:CCG83251.1 Uncharacterized protein C18B11.02c [Taphrina deformans PYCC 5710]